MKLVESMNGLAAANPRYGYRMVWTLLQRAGWRVNRKRIERLWRLEGHRVLPQRSKASEKKAWGAAEKLYLSLSFVSIAAWAAASRATGTR